MELNVTKLVLVMRLSTDSPTSVLHRSGVACIISYGTSGRWVLMFTKEKERFFNVCSNTVSDPFLLQFSMGTNCNNIFQVSPLLFFFLVFGVKVIAVFMQSKSVSQSFSYIDVWNTVLWSIDEVRLVFFTLKVFGHI